MEVELLKKYGSVSPGKIEKYVVMDTAEQEYVFLPEEKPAENQHRITVRPQSVVLLLGK